MQDVDLKKNEHGVKKKEKAIDERKLVTVPGEGVEIHCCALWSPGGESGKGGCSLKGWGGGMGKKRGES